MLTFAWVDMTVGPQPLPDWLGGACVHWMDGYANKPSVTLKVNGPVWDWEGKVWAEEGDHTLVARHPDGRAHRYGFRGEIEERDVQVWAGSAYETRRELATVQDDGLGGSWVRCPMGAGPNAGRTVILRGPWCIGPPRGYVDVAYVEPPKGGWEPGRSWHRHCAMAGLGITEDLFLRAAARFLPHCRVARISRPNWPDELEIADGAWDVPKSIRLDRLRNRRPAA